MKIGGPPGTGTPMVSWTIIQDMHISTSYYWHSQNLLGQDSDYTSEDHTGVY